jgi:tRNA(Ile)-lysidine synthase
LLQLLRGAGPAGLSAMRPETDIDGITVLRPLLGLSKSAILDYASLHHLDWIDDPSNQDTGINRNYLRHEVWPQLERRWPAAAQTISRAADHCDEALTLMQDLAREDAAQVCQTDGTLSVRALLLLSAERQRNLLRYQIERLGLPLPSTVILQRLINEVCLAGEDRTPLVSWPGVEVRRFRDGLYIQAAATTEEPEPIPIQIKGNAAVAIDEQRVLTWQPRSGQGLKQNVVNGGMTLKFRQGGERIRLQGQAQHKSLKQLFQEWGVPPWQRDRIPLLYVNGELVAVVGYGLAEGYAVHIGEKGWLPCLEG